MSFNRLLADAEPEAAARAALVMAAALVDEPTVPPGTQMTATKLLDLGVDELIQRIGSARQSDDATMGPHARERND